MKIRKITAATAEEEQIIQRLFALNETNAPFSETKVQGANIFQGDGIVYASSPRRFKLFTKTRDVKWARGEMDFRCGEAFEIEQAGEYEVNGKCVFAVYRQK